jgi:endonuclease YncB( thermonuclease family)
LTLLAFLLGASIIFADSGRVVGVHDGDTLTVLVDGRQAVKVRLWGIDAPETGQAFGNAAKQNLSGLAFGKQVEISLKTKDRYGRVVSKVGLPDGTDAGAEMIRAGMAWHYVAYAKNEAVYARLETEARKAKVGLWQEPNPVPPWNWRKAPKPVTNSFR